MTHAEAESMIAPAVPQVVSTWADIGAGTGTFTLALQALLPGGTIYALDKSPHMLWRLPVQPSVKIEVVEADFTKAFVLPKVDGMVMANALHYAPDPIHTLREVLSHLKPGGTFVLLEYDTGKANPPWVPYPVSWKQFQALAIEMGLPAPSLLARKASLYGPDEIYAAACYQVYR